VWAGEVHRILGSQDPEIPRSRDPERRVGAAVGSWGVTDPGLCESEETPTRNDIGTDGGVGLRGEGNLRWLPRVTPR
jgi:hypothetical protein